MSRLVVLKSVLESLRDWRRLLSRAGSKVAGLAHCVRARRTLLVEIEMLGDFGAANPGDVLGLAAYPRDVIFWPTCAADAAQLVFGGCIGKPVPLRWISDPECPIDAHDYWMGRDLAEALADLLNRGVVKYNWERNIIESIRRRPRRSTSWRVEVPATRPKYKASTAGEKPRNGAGFRE